MNAPSKKPVAMNAPHPRQIFIFTVPTRSHGPGISFHPAKYLSSPPLSLSQFAHWGLYIKNFDGVNPPDDQFCDVCFELGKTDEREICVKKTTLDDRRKRDPTASMNLSDQESVTEKNNEEIEAIAQATLLMTGEKYDILRANCQIFAEDIIREIRVDPRSELGVERKTLHRWLWHLWPAGKNLLPRSRPLEFGPRPPSSRKPPAGSRERGRIRAWHQQDRSHFNSWQGRDFETVWRDHRIEIWQAYSAAMEQRAEEAKIAAYLQQLRDREKSKSNLGIMPRKANVRGTVFRGRLWGFR